jgi:hypothetical protein
MSLSAKQISLLRKVATCNGKRPDGNGNTLWSLIERGLITGCPHYALTDAGHKAMWASLKSK